MTSAILTRSEQGHMTVTVSWTMSKEGGHAIPTAGHMTVVSLDLVLTTFLQTLIDSTLKTRPVCGGKTRGGLKPPLS